ncbi:MAG TPA: DUF554 domain-containing protein [Spirochaetales bacterium]|nr:DUF554 domain-containing protein [Spirochaetales bacterium]
MIATIVNCITVFTGSMLGLFLHAKISEEFKETVFTGVGLFTLIVGISMALESERMVYLALSVVCGGLIGNALDIEGKILSLGEFLKKRFIRKEGKHDFAYGFLNASVLFCVGAMTLVGAFKAGTEGEYTLILTKSVMDGFMAILLTAAQGIGVAFSILIILVYQGGLTLLAVFVKPLVTPLVLSELTGVGGALVMMIGCNLLNLRKIKTGNFLPALVVVLFLIALEPYLPRF